MNYPNPGGSPVGLPAAKPRPGRTGVWVGSALLVTAVVVPVLLVVFLVLPQFRLNEQVIPVDGAPHSLTLPRGAEYALFTQPRNKVGAPSCALTGPDDGAPIPLRTVSGTITVDNVTVLYVFDTGGGDVVVTCAQDPVHTAVVIGKNPDMGLFLGGIFGSLGFALIVGGGGLVLLIVTLVRRSRCARYW